MPSTSAAEVKVKGPAVVSVAKPTDAPPWNTSTLDPAFAVLVSVGVVSSVRWSVVMPELSANVVITGAAGPVLSIVIENAVDAGLVLAAASVAVAVKL